LPVQKSIDHTNAVITIPVNIIFFRQAGAYPKHLTVSLSPDGAANTIADMNLAGLTFSCSNAKLGEVCKASVAVTADLSNAKCSGWQTLNVKLLGQAQPWYPNGELNVSNYTNINITPDTFTGTGKAVPAMCLNGDAPRNDFERTFSWTQEDASPSAVNSYNHRYPTDGMDFATFLQSPILKHFTAKPFTLAVRATGNSLSHVDPKGLFVAIDPDNHNGYDGCVIYSGAPGGEVDVLLRNPDGTFGCLTPVPGSCTVEADSTKHDCDYGQPAVSTMLQTSAWHTLFVRLKMSHDTVDNPTQADHLDGHEVTLSVEKTKFYLVQ
jgi:hypothetical protein